MSTPTEPTYGPPPRPDIVERNRLIQQLDSAVGRRLALITGQAAQGKTTLAASYLAACGTPAAWIHLEERDSDAGRFFDMAATAFQEAFPDLELTIDEMIAEGDTVVKVWTVKGTHQGEVMGIPATGNTVNFSGFSKYRIKNGKLAECYELMDTFTMMQQLGVIPASA